MKAVIPPGGDESNKIRSTSLSTWVAAVKMALDAQGVHADSIMKELGMDVSMLDDPSARFPDALAWQLWDRALKETGDPLWGLHVARYITPPTFHALGYALMASQNLEEMFERAVRYFKVVTDAGEISYERLPTHGQLNITGHTHWNSKEREGVMWCVLDCLMLSVVRTCKIMVGPQLQFIEVRMQRPRPHDIEAFEKIFKCIPVFESADNAIVVSTEVLTRPLPFGNQMVARVNEDAMQKYMAEMGSEDLQARLRRLLREQLPSGTPSQEDLASRLAMSSRTLQRRLTELGLTYREVLNKVRHELALEYLADKRHSVSDVAYLLGYTELSTFTNAFVRWAGMSPNSWRKERLKPKAS